MSSAEGLPPVCLQVTPCSLRAAQLCSASYPLTDEVQGSCRAPCLSSDVTHVPLAQAVATNSVFVLEWTRPVALEEYFLPATGVSPYEWTQLVAKPR